MMWAISVLRATGKCLRSNLQNPTAANIISAVALAVSVYTAFIEDKPELVSVEPILSQMAPIISVHNNRYMIQAMFMSSSIHDVSLEDLRLLALGDDGVVLSRSRFKYAEGVLKVGSEIPGVAEFSSLVVPKILVTCYAFRDQKQGNQHFGYKVTSLFVHSPGMISVVDGQPVHQLLVNKQLCERSNGL